MKRILTSILIATVLSPLFAQQESVTQNQIRDAIMENRLEDLQHLLSSLEDVNRFESADVSLFDAVLVMENCPAAELLLDAGVDPTISGVDDTIRERGNARLIALLERAGYGSKG